LASSKHLYEHSTVFLDIWDSTRIENVFELEIWAKSKGDGAEKGALRSKGISSIIVDPEVVAFKASLGKQLRTDFPFEIDGSTTDYLFQHDSTLCTTQIDLPP